MVADATGQGFQTYRTIEIAGRKYSMELLGGDAVGSTSFVYLARSMSADGSADGPPLILKRFLPAEEERFRIERDVLKAVAPRDCGELGRHFPRLICEAKTIFDDQPSSLLLMEYAGAAPVTDSLPLDEQEGLLLIRHYLECLRELAEAGYTCWDRKIKDFFWTQPSVDEPAGALRVIDWNMAQPYNLTNAHNDLVTAGRLSYEVLTNRALLNRKGSSAYQFHTEWERISFGTQQLVLQLLAGARDLLRQDVDEADKKGAVDQRIVSWQQECAALHELWRSELAEDLMKPAAQLLQEGRPLEALKRTSIIALKNTKGSAGWKEDLGASSADWQAIHAEARTQAELALDPLRPLRRQLAEERESLDDVCASLQRLLREGQLSPEKELSTARWLAAATGLTQAGEDGDAWRLVLARALEAHEKALNQGRYVEAGTNWKRLDRSSLPPALQPTVAAFEAEVRIQELAERVDDLRHQRSYANALGQLDLAIEELRSLGGHHAG